MILLTKKTVVELISSAYPFFAPHIRKADKIYVPVYGDLYNLTYNQRFPETVRLENIFDYFKIKRKKVMEAFSGNAYESAELKNKYPSNTYYAADVYCYFKKLKGINYVNEDCTYLYSGNMLNTYDVIFVGETNYSLCTILDETILRKHFMWASSRLATGGIYIPAFYENTEYEKKVDIIYEPCIIRNGIYGGKYSHWVSVITHDTDSVQCVYLYTFISPDQFLNKKSVVLKAYGAENPLMTRSWNKETITYFLRLENFEQITLPDNTWVYKKL